jgi:hypothetical protein
VGDVGGWEGMTDNVLPWHIFISQFLEPRKTPFNPWGDPTLAFCQALTLVAILVLGFVVWVI